MKHFRAILDVLLVVALSVGALRTRAASPCTAYLSAPGPIPAWIAAGTVLCLRTGDYAHTTLRITANSATYTSAPGEHARLIGPDVEVFGHDVTLAGLELDADGAGQPALVLRGAADIADHLTVHHGRYSGIELRGVGDRVLSNSIYDFDSGVAGSDAHCIDVLPTAGAVTISGNTIHDCSGDGVQAFYPNSTSAPAPDLPGGAIISNTFSYGAVPYGENAIDLKRGAGWTVSGNTLSGYGRVAIPGGTSGNPAAIIHKWARDVLFTANTISDSASGVEVFGGSGLDVGANPISVTVAGNTFIRVGPGYVINVVGGISVTTAPNWNYPFGLPAPVTPTATASATATSTPLPTSTPTPLSSACERLTYWNGREVITCP